MRIFVSFGASIAGFNHCRPIIFLDRMFLKARHQDCMLAAIEKNDNNDIFFNNTYLSVLFSLCFQIL